jgi:MFS family permease
MTLLTQFYIYSLYMTMIYNRQEQGLRFAYLFGSMALSGMFGGLVATGITYIGNAGGLLAWSWLYILEGLVSLIVVPFVWFGLPENPAQAKFFTPEELEVLAARELKRREYMGDSKFDWAQVRSVLGHWRIYAAAAVQFLQDIVLYGFSTFLPSILRNDLGYTVLQSQYLSVPVYALGGISFFAAATLGDRYGLRGSILAFLDLFAVAAYLLIILVPASGVKYFACYLVAIPLYCGAGLNEMWIANNTAPHYRRATAIGFSQAIGNLAGIVSGQIYRQAPYRLGNWFSFTCTLLAMFLIGVQILDFRRLNLRKTKIKSGEIADDRISHEGEENLDFYYIY